MEMAKRKNKLLLFAISLLINSCGGYNKNKDFRLKEGDVMMENESVIIIGVGKTNFNHTLSLVNPPVQSIGQMKWCNVDTNKCFYTNPYDSRIGLQMMQVLALGAAAGTLFASETGTYTSPTEDYLIFKIPAGEYYLKSFHITSTDVEIVGKFNKKTRLATLASFKVNPKEFSYLGDINSNVCYFLHKPNTIRIIMLNNFDTATFYTLSKFSFLSPDSIYDNIITVGSQAQEDKCKVD